MDYWQVVKEVVGYFRYKRQCELVAFERMIGSLQWVTRPDVLVVNKQRYLTEVEIKLTMSDYRADQKKRVWERRRSHPERDLNRQFYYAAPADLAEKIKPELREGCGLLAIRDVNFDAVSVAARAPVRAAAKRLPLRLIAEMVKAQTGTLCSLLEIIRNQQVLLEEHRKAGKAGKE